MNSKTIQCPCCQQQKEGKNYQRVLSLFPFQGAMRDINSEQYYVDNRLYQWACDRCLKQGKAILGNPKKQYHTFSSPVDTASPYLAYFDQNRHCTQCGVKFTFSKEEQLYWYETLRFVVYSQPKQCPLCRKNIREIKALNKELSMLLQGGTPKTMSDLERIATIYSLMGNEQKAKKYQNKVKKTHRSIE